MGDQLDASFLIIYWHFEILICCKERLRIHAKSFEGLLQLIPADRYYGKDTSVGRHSISTKVLRHSKLTFGLRV